jgi:uncharacterized protein (DUF1778 family)
MKITERKTEWLHVRLSKSDKKQIKKAADRDGFSSASAYLLWHFKRHQGEIYFTGPRRTQ